jgi:hypothetical protein
VNVDQELLGFGQYISSNLRDMAAAVRGIGIQSGARTAQVYQQVSTSYNAGMSYWGGGASYYTEWRNVDGERRAIRADERAKGATSARGIASEIENATAKVRVAMCRNIGTVLVRACRSSNPACLVNTRSETAARLSQDDIAGRRLVVANLWAGLLIILKGLSGAEVVVWPISASLPSGVIHPQTLAAILLLAICFLTGLVIRTTIGRQVKSVVETHLLERTTGTIPFRNRTGSSGST